MRLVAILLTGVSSLAAQVCAPAQINPVASMDSAIDANSCMLSDGTPYASYALTLPVRGQIALDLTSPAATLMLRDASGTQIVSGSSIHRPVEAGEYLLLVNAASPASYSLRSSFTPEAGMLCAGFPNFGLNQTAGGMLGASGCRLPDGTPYEGYSLGTYGSGTLTITVSSTVFNPVVTLRDDDGYAIASGAASITAPVDGSSQYQIVVSTADQPGSFQIATTFQPADGETCVPQKTLAGTMSDNASINASSCTAPITNSGDLAYFNLYDVVVDQAGLADLRVASTDFGATLYLLDQAGNQIASDLGGGASPDESEIRVQLAPGKYIAEVYSSLPAGGAYVLNYQFTPVGPQPCVPIAANPGDAPAGALGPSSCRTDLGLGDIYSVTLTASGTLDIGLSATGFTTQLGVRDAKDNLIVLNQDTEGVGASHLTVDLPAGAYSLVAALTAGAGTYQLTTSFIAHDLAQCGFVQPLSIDGGYIQKLGPGSCRGKNGEPVDLYQFTLPADSVVAGFMTSSEVTSSLTITGPNGDFVRSDTGSYDGVGAMAIQYLPAGTYQIAARAAGSTLGGYYEVDLRNAAGARPAFCNSRGKIVAGANLAGSLGIASCQYTDGTFADIYELDVASDGAIDLRLNSTSFDAYLVLLDAKGNVVDQDDDSGGNTNARINRQVSAGVYYVVAKPISSYTSVGGYTLSLN